jgi:1,4-alpha-glucan branching enzyme
VWTWLRAPALSPLAAAAGALVVAAAALGVAEWHGAHAARPRAAVVARLTYRAPGARQVAVAADFNGWKPEAARMQRGEGGVWTLEVPLPPGRRYEYMFVVDGRWVTDPNAPASVDDGFGGRNAVLDL